MSRTRIDKQLAYGDELTFSSSLGAFYFSKFLGNELFQLSIQTRSIVKMIPRCKIVFPGPVTISSSVANEVLG